MWRNWHQNKEQIRSQTYKSQVTLFGTKEEKFLTIALGIKVEIHRFLM